MPMVVSGLISRLTAIYSREYSSDAGTVLFSEAARIILPANSAAAWADALSAYGMTATALGASPVSLEANKGALLSALTPVFSGQGSPTFVNDLVTAFSSLWLTPPVTFVNGGFVTDATIGILPAVSAILALPPVPNNATAAASMASIIDAYFRTVIVTVPQVPPAPPLLVPLV